MPWDGERRGVHLARLGLLMALAGAVQAAETVFPTPVPWFRLGLGNAAVLLALHLWGARAAAWVGLGKVFVGGVLTARFLSPGFLLSLGGTSSAVAVMAAARFASPPLGFVGVSVLGAEAHALAQLALASVLLRTPAVWSLVPLLGTLSVLAGCVTGWVAHRAARALESEGGVPGAP